MKMTKRITLQPCSLKHNINKVYFLFTANWNYLIRIEEGGSPPPPSPSLPGYTHKKIQAVAQKNSGNNTMKLLWFFGTQSVYCIIMEIDYGWLIELCFLIKDCQQNTKNLKLIVLAGTVGVKKLDEPMLKSYATMSPPFSTKSRGRLTRFTFKVRQVTTESNLESIR